MRMITSFKVIVPYVFALQRDGRREDHREISVLSRPAAINFPSLRLVARRGRTRTPHSIRNRLVRERRLSLGQLAIDQARDRNKSIPVARAAIIRKCSLDWMYLV